MSNAIKKRIIGLSTHAHAPELNELLLVSGTRIRCAGITSISQVAKLFGTRLTTKEVQRKKLSNFAISYNYMVDGKFRHISNKGFDSREEAATWYKNNKVKMETFITGMDSKGDFIREKQQTNVVITKVQSIELSIYGKYALLD